MEEMMTRWILRARDRDRDILARLRFGHQRPVNRGCPTIIGHPRFTGRWCPSRCPRIFSQSVIVYILVFFVWTPAIYWSLVSKPVSQDIQSICYCLHPGIFRLDTCDLLVAGVRISISPKYLYLYLALKLLTMTRPEPFPVSKVALLVYRARCGTLTTNQSKQFGCVMKFATIHFNDLI